MEDLFSARLSVEDRQVSYRVVFKEEDYHFVSDDGASEFSLRREHDEWHENGTLAPGLKDQAVTALENYLLQQH